ncbi:MAG TPA: hypothetical protein VHD56_11145 [Tepidisphaeraceae bacterium]|nr:hypothetical protein [Tepidisphaeraceae bacterium]
MRQPTGSAAQIRAEFRIITKLGGANVSDSTQSLRETDLPFAQASAGFQHSQAFSAAIALRQSIAQAVKAFAQCFEAADRFQDS